MAVIKVDGHIKIKNMQVSDNTFIGGDGQFLDASSVEGDNWRFDSNILITDATIEKLRILKTGGVEKSTAIAKVMSSVGRINDITAFVALLDRIWDSIPAVG